MPKKIVAANWKMNNDEYSSKKLTFDFLKHISESKNTKVLKILSVPFPFLNTVTKICEGVESVFVAAQNSSNYSEGAYTGEVSAKMLSSISVPFSLVGHSERREVFGESDDIVFAKTSLLLENNITPIFCCGEPINIRKDNSHLSFVEEQLNLSVFKLKSSEFKKIIIAYEPVWAIGTGETASENDISEAEKLDKILQPIHHSMFVESNPSPVKYAAKLLNLCEDDVRLPLVKVTEQTKEIVKKSLQSAKLI